MRFRFSRLHLLGLLALVGISAGSAPASAQVLLEEYTAFLGPADHFNSNGTRLTQPWQIVRQDRANFHRFGIRDAGDEWDSFFASTENRERVEAMIRNGSISASAANAVVNGSVWIRVQIFGSGNLGQFVNVLVQ